jgi:hypothetical protein
MNVGATLAVARPPKIPHQLTVVNAGATLAVARPPRTTPTYSSERRGDPCGRPSSRVPHQLTVVNVGATLAVARSLKTTPA